MLICGPQLPVEGGVGERLRPSAGDGLAQGASFAALFRRGRKELLKKGVIGGGGFGPLEMALPPSTNAVDVLGSMYVGFAEVRLIVEDEDDA